MGTSSETAPGGSTTQANASAGERSVADVMSTALLTVAGDESLLMAWELIQRTGFHHLPVVDEDGRSVGLLERGELAVACALPAISLAERYVGDLLSGGVQPHVPTSARLAEVAEVMTDHAVDAVVVTNDNDAMVGLVTARDLVSALAGRKPAHGPSDRGPVLFRLEPVLPPERHT
ncbi:CBS domain-containing protein [Embleya sp. NBC_00896]|uniref:CBS domain-containing protein n=1 Tax=Embleya sp. NBC_00896 TaxID=2975961 RepID=UPI002F915216|nr:CBS domain-containing protein [Embleya sp. NBC_00896]